jgi:NAD(P)H dehydrogenase (quinone)
MLAAMRALIVHAHPEPRSFNAALRDASVATLAEAGWTVVVSDLYADRFEPAAGREDFTTCLDPERLNLSLEQRHALSRDGLAPDIARELGRLLETDLLVLQFPLWWFGMPAILKGWIDRVFVSGAVYGRSATHERGRLRGKRALVCVTTGAPPESFGPHALNGDIMDLLAPLHRGVLGFTGMTVLPPFVAYHVPYVGDDARRAMIAAWRHHLRELDALVPVAMPRLADHPEADVGARRPPAQ